METSIILIVFSIGGDPVGADLVGSLRRPGAKLRERHFYALLLQQQVDLLHDSLPEGCVLGVIVNPENACADADAASARSAAIHPRLEMGEESVR